MLEPIWVPGPKPPACIHAPGLGKPGKQRADDCHQATDLFQQLCKPPQGAGKPPAAPLRPEASPKPRQHPPYTLPISHSNRSAAGLPQFLTQPPSFKGWPPTCLGYGCQRRGRAWDRPAPPLSSGALQASKWRPGLPAPRPLPERSRVEGAARGSPSAVPTRRALKAYFPFFFLFIKLHQRARALEPVVSGSYN